MKKIMGYVREAGKNNLKDIGTGAFGACAYIFLWYGFAM